MKFSIDIINKNKKKYSKGLNEFWIIRHLTLWLAYLPIYSQICINVYLQLRKGLFAHTLLQVYVKNLNFLWAITFNLYYIHHKFGERVKCLKVLRKDWFFFFLIWTDSFSEKNNLVSSVSRNWLFKKNLYIYSSFPKFWEFGQIVNPN